jgi:TetR/AcrR family transcriptional regulator, cholesterol catabolism regulator
MLLFGALNWSVQWFDAARQATLDDLSECVMQLFLKRS